MFPIPVCIVCVCLLVFFAGVNLKLEALSRSHENFEAMSGKVIFLAVLILGAPYYYSPHNHR
jgi:hypothetical protein